MGGPGESTWNSRAVDVVIEFWFSGCMPIRFITGLGGWAEAANLARNAGTFQALPENPPPSFDAGECGREAFINRFRR